MNLRSTRWAELRLATAHLLEALQTWPWMETLRTLRARFREDRLGLTAGSLTFTTTMALVPLFTVMLALFTAFPVFGSFRAALERYFIQSLIPASIAKPVLGTLTQFAAKASKVGSVGLVTVVVVAVALMLTIDRTLNGIWRVRKPRPIAYRVLVYWAAATLGPLLLGLSLSMTSWALSASRGWVGDVPGGVKSFFAVTQFVLMAAGMSALFRYVPNTHVRWQHAWAGGVFVAVGFELTKRVLAWYLGKVPTYSTIYGAFATVPIFLLWLYIGWVIVLLGAVIAAYAPSLQMRVTRLPDTPGHRFTLAVKLLTVLARARDGSSRGLTADQLAHALRLDPLQIEPVLESLMEMDWVARLDEEGAARHVLLCDPDRTAAAPLIEGLLLARSDAVEGMWNGAGLAEVRLADLLRGAQPALPG
jgi:membrane protein